ncbi:histidinol dehydrogenase [Micrococcales bacterium 31B]|nr:histidinol dehydrogenase [Micrococcales bacterium 31B]
MLNQIDLRGRTPSLAELRRIVPRAELSVDVATDTVRPLLADLQQRGGEALRELGERFDGVRPPHLRVPATALREALESLDPQIRAALDEAIRRVRDVDADQVRADDVTEVAPGALVTQRWVPVRRVGMYVPGGRAVLPSSVVMNVVPAQTAGVPELAVASPPQKEFGGLPHPTILAACELLGVTEVYAVGGAQAIGMFAYGAEGIENPGEQPLACDPVDLITGPGNVYVAAAKRLVQGMVGIDSEAGPTEIAILADDTADADHVASDLISQAEHDPLAGAVLVTDSPDLAAATLKRVAARTEATAHSARVTEALTGTQSAVILVDDIEQGLRVVDAYAAEHLEIHTANARELAFRVNNAGAIFVGPYAPVSLGDYCAGSNHVLPTGGCAAYSSGLGVQTFLKGVHVVEYDEAALKEVADHVVTLANSENLPAHGEAVRARFEG